MLQTSKIILLLLCFTVSIWSQNNLVRFEKSIEEGNLAIEKDLFQYVIANPKDANGFLLLSKLRLKQNRLNEAKSLAQKALSIDENLLSAKLNLASIHYKLGEIEQSRNILNSISDTEIKSDSVRLSLAKNSVQIGDCPKTLILVEKLPLKIKNTEALALRAECYLKTNDQKNFAALLPIAKITAKQNQTIAVEFAEVLSNAGKHKETVELLRLVAVAPSKNFTALILLAKSEIYLKDLANAKIHLAQAEKIAPNSTELFFVKSLLEGEQGENQKALDLLEKSLADNPNNVQILVQYVVSAMRANYPSKAVRAAEKLLQIQPDNLDFLYLYGAASLQNKNLAAAENSLSKFMESRPNDSRGCVALGLVFAAQPEKLDIARQQMQKCLAMNPNNSEAAYQLGLSYKANGEIAKAVEYLEIAAKLTPDNASVLRDLGTVYLQNSLETKARPILEKSVAINANDSETHFQLSRLYNLLGERELARKHLEIFQKLRNPKKEGM